MSKWEYGNYQIYQVIMRKLQCTKKKIALQITVLHIHQYEFLLFLPSQYSNNAVKSVKWYSILGRQFVSFLQN